MTDKRIGYVLMLIAVGTLFYGCYLSIGIVDLWFDYQENIDQLIAESEMPGLTESMATAMAPQLTNVIIEAIVIRVLPFVIVGVVLLIIADRLVKRGKAPIKAGQDDVTYR